MGAMLVSGDRRGPQLEQPYERSYLSPQPPPPNRALSSTTEADLALALQALLLRNQIPRAAAPMMDPGSSKTPPPAISNGGTSASPLPLHQSDLAPVLEALQAIYSTHTSNDTRRQASEYLDQAKRLPNAPSHGFTLALDTTQPPQLRHYGLHMLEHSIKYKWEDYSASEGEALRNYVIQLAQNIEERDPVYLRNKVAQLWTETAKRSWGAEWMDMDKQLVELWRNSLHHQAIVLYVLETLSEEVFNREDTTAGLRSNELGRACVEVFTPAAVLAEHLPTRDKSLDVRYGDEGWLKRLCDNLEWCLQNNYQTDERTQACAEKTLNTLRAAMSWVMPKAIAAVQLVEHVCKAIAVPVVPMQQAAVAVLHALYHRHHPLTDEEFVELVCPMYTSGSVRLLTEVYQWTLADMNVQDLDEQKYTLCKKLAELVAVLGNYIEQKPASVPEGSDLSGMFGLLFEIFRHPSLIVSIPVLHCWTKLLRSPVVRSSEVVSSMIGGLLETCCSRLVRYESFPEDSEDPTILFLNEDIDTIPEKHAFLGNYRRFCAEIVEVLVRRTPIEAMDHILGQSSALFQNLYSGQPAFTPQNFSKHSSPVLRVDAQITVIDAALKGYLKWLMSDDTEAQQFERDRNQMENSFEQWCRQMLQARFEDPEVAKKIVQLMATFSTKALPDRPDFALQLLDYILHTNLPEIASCAQYTESVKDLERTCSLEMQKLAMLFADDFMAVYQTLENKINEIVAARGTDERQRMAFTAFLFIIVHRTSNLDRTVQENQLREHLSGVREAWSNDQFTKSVSSFESFCELLGMGRLAEFMSTRDFQNVADWSSQPLDSEGQAMQADVLERSHHLPLRLTKTLLAASIEKLRDGSKPYEIAALLWAEVIPVILPNLLQLVSHAQAFNNVDANWSNLPPSLQQVIRRVLTDRFWQSGISTESRDDFFARVSSSKSTYEGFASTIRGTVRQIRESCYYVLYSLTRFKDFFYGIPDLPQPLAQALFANAQALSAHHLSVLLGVSTHLIDGCPAHIRAHFLPPVISGLFGELDRKVSTEWATLNQKIAESGEDDNLTEEMKTESILRQLTYSSVTLTSQLLDMHRPDPLDEAEGSKDYPMWKFIIATPSVLEPILLFLKTTIRVRDTRSVVGAVRVFRQVISRFKQKSPIHDFFCDDLLKAAITSLHEPQFVDCQKDLASLIATIIHLDQQTPRAILLSLPGMEDTQRVDRRLAKLHAAHRQDERMQRSIVLDLLSSVRGVSIHEQGKIERAKPKKRTAFQEQYMSVDPPVAIVRGGSPGLAGVADMFGNA